MNNDICSESPIINKPVMGVIDKNIVCPECSAVLIRYNDKYECPKCDKKFANSDILTDNV